MIVMINIDTWSCKQHDVYAGQWYDKRVQNETENWKDHQGVATSDGSHTR